MKGRLEAQELWVSQIFEGAKNPLENLERHVENSGAEPGDRGDASRKFLRPDFGVDQLVGRDGNDLGEFKRVRDAPGAGAISLFDNAGKIGRDAPDNDRRRLLVDVDVAHVVEFEKVAALTSLVTRENASILSTRVRL